MSAPAYTGAVAAASVIMSPAVRSKPVLFVEGLCEVRLVSHHYPEHEEQIVPCGGHAGVKEAIAAIEKWEATNNSTLMVLGFIDRDYGSQSRHKRITTSNYRDVEIDMYRSKAGARVLREKASRNKCPDPTATLNEALEALRSIGLIRKHNSNAGCCWCINEVNIERCVDGDGILDTEKFLSLLQQRNTLPEQDLQSLRCLLKASDGVMTEAVIRGHDVSLLIGKWLRKKIGNRRKAETAWAVIEEDLRLATEHGELLRYNWARRIDKHLTNAWRATK